jgi:hypothetical protein
MQPTEKMMILNRFTTRLITCLITLAGAAAVGTLVHAGTDTPASFTIDAVSGATVFSDGGLYEDYRLVDGSSSLPICVESLISSTGSIFNRLNREMPSGGRCGVVGGIARNFRIAVDNPTACDALFDYGLGLTNSLGTGVWSGTGACILAQVDSPRIRVGKTFGSRVTRTDLAFLITMLNPPPGHGGFEIQPKDSAAVQADGTSRIVKFNGLAKLVKFSTGTTKPAAIPNGDFALNFQITFTPGP